MGSIIVTPDRILAYTFTRRQLNLATRDARCAYLYVSSPNGRTARLEFDVGLFRDGWRGEVALEYKLEAAQALVTALQQVGCSSGPRRRRARPRADW